MFRAFEFENEEQREATRLANIADYPWQTYASIVEKVRAEMGPMELLVNELREEEMEANEQSGWGRICKIDDEALYDKRLYTGVNVIFEVQCDGLYALLCAFGCKVDHNIKVRALLADLGELPRIDEEDERMLHNIGDLALHIGNLLNPEIEEQESKTNKTRKLSAEQILKRGADELFKKEYSAWLKECEARKVRQGEIANEKASAIDAQTTIINECKLKIDQAKVAIRKIRVDSDNATRTLPLREAPKREDFYKAIKLPK